MVALAVLAPLSFPEKLDQRHQQMLSGGQGPGAGATQVEMLNQ